MPSRMVLDGATAWRKGEMLRHAVGCRAVLAARRAGEQVADRVLIREVMPPEVAACARTATPAQVCRRLDVQPAGVRRQRCARQAVGRLRDHEASREAVGSRRMPAESVTDGDRDGIPDRRPAAAEMTPAYGRRPTARRATRGGAGDVQRPDLAAGQPAVKGNGVTGAVVSERDAENAPHGAVDRGRADERRAVDVVDPNGAVGNPDLDALIYRAVAEVDFDTDAGR